MTQNAVREAAARAKIEIDDQIDQFIDKLDRASNVNFSKNGTA